MRLRKVSLSPTYAHPSPLPFPMNLKIDIDNQGFACAPTPQQRGVESICQLRMADQATGRLTYAPPSRLPRTRARSFARPDRAFGCAEFLSLHSQATTVSPLRGEEPQSNDSIRFRRSMSKLPFRGILSALRVKRVVMTALGSEGQCGFKVGAGKIFLNWVRGGNAGWFTET
jgi:hypothetical protein